MAPNADLATNKVDEIAKTGQEGGPSPSSLAKAPQVQQPQTLPSGQKASRWLEPMQAEQIESFIETYMPWMPEQRRRAQEAGKPNSGVGFGGDAAN